MGHLKSYNIVICLYLCFSILDISRLTSYFSVCFFSFFLDGVLLCHPCWSAVVQSQLTAASAFQIQVIPLSQPPKVLGLQGMSHCTQPS